jgi:hypothetical protein
LLADNLRISFKKAIKSLKMLVVGLAILLVLQVILAFGQLFPWFVTSLTCNPEVTCFNQQVNISAHVNFRVTFPNLYIYSYGRGYAGTFSTCANGASVRNDAKVTNDFFWVGYDHRSDELNGFNQILTTVQQGTLSSTILGDLIYTPAVTLYFPELCSPPTTVAGGCNGLPDWGTYPSGCASGFVYSGGVCTRSSGFISNCDMFGGYDDSSCGCFGGCAPELGGCSPVLIDVSGDGFALTNAANGVNFDVGGNGTPERRAWTAPGTDDAWLVLDRNGNGTIDGGRELFGSSCSQPPPPVGIELNGFNALNEYDKAGFGGNGDGFISQQDAIFSSLRLWQDTNHNGISEFGELHTLVESGLRKIDLDYRESRRIDQYGNQFKYRAKVRDAHGTQLGRWAWDVFLVTEP